MGRRTKQEIDAERSSAIAKPKEQVIAEHIAQAGGVPVITGGTPPDQGELGEWWYCQVVPLDGQVGYSTAAIAGKRKNGQRFRYTAAFVPGREALLPMALINQLQVPSEEEITLGLANDICEAARMGRPGPADDKCKQLGCTSWELRAGRVVFLRRKQRWTIVPMRRRDSVQLPTG